MVYTQTKIYRHTHIILGERQKYLQSWREREREKFGKRVVLKLQEMEMLKNLSRGVLDISARKANENAQIKQGGVCD